MSETILATEATTRLAAFPGVPAATALWEMAAPRRRPEIPRMIRWTNNLALVVVDTVILRLSFPIIAVGLAVMAEDHIDAPVRVAILVSMLLLDLAIYLQHVMFHAVPGLWRLNRMRHADLDFDATTGLPFHPVENGDQACGGRGPRPTRHRRAALRMEIGIEQFRIRRDLLLDRMLTQPVRGAASGHSFDPRNTKKEPAE